MNKWIIYTCPIFQSPCPISFQYGGCATGCRGPCLLLMAVMKMMVSSLNPLHFPAFKIQLMPMRLLFNQFTSILSHFHLSMHLLTVQDCTLSLWVARAPLRDCRWLPSVATMFGSFGSMGRSSSHYISVILCTCPFWMPKKCYPGASWGSSRAESFCGFVARRGIRILSMGAPVESDDYIC